MNWIFPSENQTPYFDAIEAFYGQQDAAAYAAREDRHIILRGGGTVSFVTAGGTLSWTDDFEMLAAVTGFKWRIPASSIQLLDGEIAWVELVRAPSNNLVVVLQKGNQIPSSDTAHILGVRVGARVYFFNGSSVIQGSPVTDIGAGGGGGGGSALEILDEGTSQTAGATSIDFVGSGVTASAAGSAVTVTVGVGGGVPQMTGNTRVQVVDDTLLNAEIKLGGFQFNPSLFSGSTMVLGGLVTLTDAGGVAPALDLRLYDMGTTLVPQAGDLRASRLFSIPGSLRFEQTILVPSATPTTPGSSPDDGTMYDVARIYEVRALLTGDAGDLAEIDWAGIQGV